MKSAIDRICLGLCAFALGKSEIRASSPLFSTDASDKIFMLKSFGPGISCEECQGLFRGSAHQGMSENELGQRFLAAKGAIGVQHGI